MGCYHHRDWADAAEIRKATLVETLEEEEKEVEACNEASAEISAIISIVNSYANTFQQLGDALAVVKVNNKAYDNGKCGEIAGQIKTIGDDLSKYSEAIATYVEYATGTTIPQLKEDIKVEDVIIGQRNNTCSSCQAAAAAARRARAAKKQAEILGIN